MYGKPNKICPDCGKKLEVVYSGLHEATVYMCMNARCPSYSKSFGIYHYNQIEEEKHTLTLDEWM